MRVPELRYLQIRRNGDGSLRWYWRRAGRVVRLPDDPVVRMAEATRLNSAADVLAAGGPAEPARGGEACTRKKYGMQLDLSE